MQNLYSTVQYQYNRVLRCEELGDILFTSSVLSHFPLFYFDLLFNPYLFCLALLMISLHTWVEAIIPKPTAI